MITRSVLPGLLLLLSPFACSSSHAHSVVYVDDPDVSWLSPYVSYEANDLGQITTLGGLFQTGRHFQLAVGVATYQSDNNGQHNGYQPELDFVNLDTSVRVGVFDNISLYGEVGLALDELIFDEEEEDYYDRWGGHYEKMGPIDWFAGVGAGIELNNLSLRAFGRYRYLRSYEQEYLAALDPWVHGQPDDGQWFAGVELSLRF
ncbi:hypothetical protein [Rheinheimera sp. F8]|uniref:hypothetical protein n=1 Tax=Rheinheimera sp. F8 TaxID=1763998 RepID=UPI000744ABC6|nr:hypothetical protein [Rheinheimera sp. F8]ALZ75134.1 hypothetical protein ATY27_04765 [Rheinheimera sp. F8]ALZ76441.1 hypothetical protein ATY27_12180 [Rheinheimera sp. F8]